MPALALRGLDADTRRQIAHVPLLNVVVVQLGKVEHKELVAQGRHLIERTCVALEPREGLLSDLRVDAFKAPAQPLDAVGVARAAAGVPLRVHPVHGPVLDAPARGQLLGRDVERAAPVVHERVHVAI